jgi:hypothetical protein
MTMAGGIEEESIKPFELFSDGVDRGLSLKKPFH